MNLPLMTSGPNNDLKTRHTDDIQNNLSSLVQELHYMNFSDEVHLNSKICN